MKRFAVSAFAAVLLGIVAMLIVPLPPFLLDVLLAIDILAAALVLLLAVSVEDPLEFSAFAPALLVATLFRLALDISATRLILTHGAVPGGVGAIVPAFGAFVVQNNPIVGLIVFAILVTIQFVVIASGSQRVAEVAARFTLDAMPGKQMAIDADLHAGALDGEQARRKRELVAQEADFYGAMDGAGKFVKGDSVAALVIVALNLLGGIAVGTLYDGLSPAEAFHTFALLSIGNALVTTLPAFLISVAMGMMVTRVAANGALGSDLAVQLFARPEVLRGVAVLLAALSFVPALPRPIFLALAASCWLAAHLAMRRARANERRTRSEREDAKRRSMRRPEIALGLVGVDAVAIEFAPDLAALLALPHSDALLDRIGEVRRALAAEIGIVVPGVRLRDDLARERGYAIRVRDRIVASGELRLDALLAVADEAVLAGLGEITREPVYDLPAAWIAPERRAQAQERGALVFDAISILGSHLAEIVRANAAELFGRQEFQTLLDHLRLGVPTLVKEIAPDALAPGSVHRAWQQLLRERIWPRDPVLALDAMLAAGGSEPRELCAAARGALVPAQLRRSGAEALAPLLIEPIFERSLAVAWAGDPSGVDPQAAIALREQVARWARRAGRGRLQLLCGSLLRPLLAEFLARSGIEAEVLAFSELPPELAIEPLGTIEAPEPRSGKAATAD
uniref:Flagellar biosynthesis protein flhA n=1 Tax=mine drainage metagenome TaxID=410659 RepID=E6Q5C0_9ZZZZ